MFKILRFRSIVFPFIKKSTFLIIDIDSYSVDQLLNFLDIKNGAVSFDQTSLKLNANNQYISISQGDYIFRNHDNQICALPKSSFFKFFMIEEDLCCYHLLAK